MGKVYLRSFWGISISLAGISAILFLGDFGRIRASAHEKIRLGMSQTEVAATIGVPPGDYRFWDLKIPAPSNFCFGDESEHWVTDKGTISVTYDDNKRVVAKGFCSDSECERIFKCPRFISEFLVYFKIW